MSVQLEGQPHLLAGGVRLCTERWTVPFAGCCHHMGGGGTGCVLRDRQFHLLMAAVKQQGGGGQVLCRE